MCPSRYCKGGKQLLKPSFKVLLPQTAGFLLKILTGIPTYDPTNSFKLYSAKIFDEIELQSTVSFSVTLEIVSKAYLLGYQIIEVPTTWKDRTKGVSNFKLLHSIPAYLKWFLLCIFKRFFKSVVRTIVIKNFYMSIFCTSHKVRCSSTFSPIWSIDVIKINTC